MKYLPLLLAVQLGLQACGTDPDTTKPTAETAESIPDFTRWSQEPGAIDTCTQVDSSNVSCRTEFTADDENCGNATFKFVSIKDGYMYVQTKVEVIVRQGENHILTFDEKPEIYNIADKYSEKYYHVFQCKGQEG